MSDEDDIMEGIDVTVHEGEPPGGAPTPDSPQEAQEAVEEWHNDNDRKLKAAIQAGRAELTTDGKWRPTDHTNISPSLIGHLKAAPFIEVVADTNSQTICRTHYPEAVIDAAEEILDRPEEGSEAELLERIRTQEGSLLDQLNQVTVSDDDRAHIRYLTEDHDALDYWKDYVDPHIKYRPRAKKAILLMLGSPPDKHGTKGRVNVLFYGPPGTGKTEFKNFLRDEFQATTIDGPRVSKADLTYNKNTGNLGALPRAHQGVVAIEEADEMDSEAVGSALTALGESGEVEIRDMTLPAEVRGIMLTNFDSRDAIARAWSPESLNRFDFTLRLERLADDEKDDTLDSIYEDFRQPSSGGDIELFKKYLSMVHNYEPEIVDREEIKRYKSQHIAEIGNIREGVSVMNVAFTIARLNLSDVTVDHFAQALDLTTAQSA